MQFVPLLVAVAATALALGCQQAPAPPAAVADSTALALPHVSRAAKLKAEGDALVAKADHRAAAEVYRRAVALDPDDLSILFALGTAHTFLDQKREATEAFRGVVARGDPASVEYREARRWLAAAGVAVGLALPPAGAPESASPQKPGTEVVAAPEKIVGGRLVGHMEWPGIDPKVRSIRGEMWIYGAEASTEGVKRSRPISLGGRYHFYDIPPGQYRITARLFVQPKDVMVWDQKVRVEEGRPTEIVLTPATALVPPDKFPPPPAS